MNVHELNRRRPNVQRLSGTFKPAHFILLKKTKSHKVVSYGKRL